MMSASKARWRYIGSRTIGLVIQRPGQSIRQSTRCPEMHQNPDSGKQSFRQEVVRKAMVTFKAGENFSLDRHPRMHEAIEQYLFAERRDVLRLVTSSARPDDEAH